MPDDSLVIQGEVIDYIKGFYEHINKKIVIRGLR